jgi:hypothetical protein
MTQDEPKVPLLARLQAYSSGVPWPLEEVDTAFVRSVRPPVKWLFDPIRNVFILGILKYVANKSGNPVLKDLYQICFALLIAYCLSYTQNFHFRFFHPWWPANWAKVADNLLILAVIVPLTWIIVYMLPIAIEDIAKSQTK